MDPLNLWCEMAWLGGSEPVAGVLIEVHGDRIESVREGVGVAPGGATILRGLTLPGLANAHSHCFQRALRGRTEREAGGSFWSWRESMYALAEAVADESVFEALARATFAEMALAGFTLVGEFDYIHHSEAVARAAAAAGVRLTLIDACYLHGGIPLFRDSSAEAWAERMRTVEASGSFEAGGRARLAAAIHSVRAVDPDSAAVVAAFANERGWPLHAHLSEQVRENEECLAEHAVTPTALLARAGALSDRFTAVHATHLTDDDVRLLRDADAYTCMCPTTERDLADGIGTVPTERLTFGSDSQSVIDPFEEARAVELDNRLATGVRGRFDAPGLLRGLASTGYASLGWPEGGELRTGALADLVTVSLDGPRLAGTRVADALDSVVFAASGVGDVSDVIVGGRAIVRDGAHVTLDVRAELTTAIRAALGG